MDLILHKKLMALQAENVMLREEIQKLQETSPERISAYMGAAGKDLHNQANMQGRDFAHGLIARAKRDDHNANLAFAAADKAGRRAVKRRSGIERAARLLSKNATPTDGFVKTIRNREDGGIHQTLHTHDGKHYVISSNSYETLIFPSDQHGNYDSGEIGGGDRPEWDNKHFDANRHHTNTFKEYLRDRIRHSNT